MAVSQISASPIPDADADAKPQRSQPQQQRGGRQVALAPAVVPVEVRKTVLICIGS